MDLISPLLMQVNATIPPIQAASSQDVATTITALIVSIAGMLGAVAAIMQSVGQRKELGKHGEALQQAASYLDDVGKHIVSSKEDIKSLAEITYGFAPDKAKEIVNQQNVRLQELTQKLQDAQEKLKKVPPAISRV